MSSVEATNCHQPVNHDDVVDGAQLDHAASTNISLHTTTQEHADAQSGTQLTRLPPNHSEEPFPRSLKERLVRLVPRNAPQVSYVLENVGSVARDHLANERTWLAYLRTSLAIAGTGVALVQLFTIAPSNKSSPHQKTPESFARPLGATIVIVAFGVLGIGVYRYFKIQKSMTQGVFPVARSTIIVITAVLASLAALIFAILVALPR